MHATLQTPEAIDRFRLMVLRSALYLETKGMHRRGRPASQIVREVTGLRERNKVKLLAKFDAYMKEAAPAS